MNIHGNDIKIFAANSKALRRFFPVSDSCIFTFTIPSYIFIKHAFTSYHIKKGFAKAKPFNF